MTNQINNQSIIPSTDVIQLPLTLKMTTAQVVETSVTVNNNGPIQDYVHPDDQTQPTFDIVIALVTAAILTLRFFLTKFDLLSVEFDLLYSAKCSLLTHKIDQRHLTSFSTTNQCGSNVSAIYTIHRLPSLALLGHVIHNWLFSVV